MLLVGGTRLRADDLTGARQEIDATFAKELADIVSICKKIGLPERAEETASWQVRRDPRRQDGWYVQISYHFFPDAWRGKHALLTDESTFTLTLRVEEIDLNDATKGTTFRDDLFQTTLGLNFRPVERSVVKFDFVWIDSDQDGSPEYRVLISWATYF